MKSDAIVLAMQDIRRQCRLAMNGVASTSMREKGLSYKLNFGLMQSQIRTIASSYAPDRLLAEALWNENTRELKIMATMLYPVETFSADEAEVWVRGVCNQEIREQVCLNLFSRLSFAEDAARKWANDSDSNIRLTGYWLLGRLFVSRRMHNIPDLSTCGYIASDLTGNNLFMRNAALLILKYIGRQSKEKANEILNAVSYCKDSADPFKSEIYDDLLFEFEYYFDSKQ